MFRGVRLTAEPLRTPSLPDVSTPQPPHTRPTPLLWTVPSGTYEEQLGAIAGWGMECRGPEAAEWCSLDPCPPGPMAWKGHWHQGPPVAWV